MEQERKGDESEGRNDVREQKHGYISDCCYNQKVNHQKWMIDNS